MSTTTLVQPVYIVATALFIFALHWMNTPATARRGVYAGVAAMTLAVLVTWIQPEVIHHGWIILAIAAGFVVGVPLAMVPLTAVPQRTALSHAFGGAAAGLVGTAEYYLGLGEGPETLTKFRTAGVSSAHAVERVKDALRIERAGHGGTLDPLATGVLPICLGAATKLAQYLLGEDKAYEAEGLLGIETDTLDRTGKITAERAGEVTREALLAAMANRMGAQEQLPPMYSAIKQGGVRLYHRARAGEDVERAVRPIRIDRLKLLAFEPPRFRIAIACSKGTYVRSLVADLGSDLGLGAHLTELRRTRSGKFTIAQAVRLDQVGELDLALHLIPMTQATTLPSVVAPTRLLGQVRSGVQLPVSTWGAENHERFMILAEDGRLLAIAHADAGRTVYDRVFPAAGEA